jgi:uncharacterized protein YndB with AHSA1/START domain
MTDQHPMKHGTLSLTREIKAPRALVYEAWTQLEHRRQWFKGPGWTEAERHLDLRVGGSEVARGHFPDGTETRYESRFHLVEPDQRLIYAFDMHVAGQFFSVSLAGVDFEDSAAGTTLTYTEQGFFLVGDYDAESRAGGTTWLLDQLAAYLAGVAR